MPNKKNKRGSGNKSKQFDAAIAKDIQEGGLDRLKGFMDSPGMQGPAERQREEQIRKMIMKQHERMMKDEMLRAPVSRNMDNELERLRQLRRKK